MLEVYNDLIFVFAGLT